MFSFCQGVLQTRVAKSYIMEHFKESSFDDEKLIFEVQRDNRYPDLVCVQFQSRHSRPRTYNAPVRFDSQQEPPIQGWYSTSVSGSRQFGYCAHITALLCHLGVNQAHMPDLHRLPATHLLKHVEDSNLYDHGDASDNDDNNVLYSMETDNDS